METRVKWGNSLSFPVHVSAGVGQGSVLAPSLFALYVDKMLVKLHKSGLGCHIKNFCFNSIMYANDVLLLAISVADLQEIINLCLSELSLCHLTVNPSKSTCMGLGSQHDIPECVIVISGHLHSWARELKFLGFVIAAGNSFKCKIQINKQFFLHHPTPYLVVSTSRTLITPCYQ